MEKRRNKSMIVMAVLLVLAVGYIAYGAYNNYDNTRVSAAYQQGFIDAQTVVNQNIINGLNTQGFVAFTAPTSDNTTATFKLGIVE